MELLLGDLHGAFIPECNEALLFWGVLLQLEPPHQTAPGTIFGKQPSVLLFIASCLDAFKCRYSARINHETRRTHDSYLLRGDGQSDRYAGLIKVCQLSAACR